MSRLSKQKTQTVRWPNICIACSATKNLQQHLYTRRKNVSETPQNVHVEGQQPYIWVDASVHLCPNCLKKAKLRYILTELFLFFILIGGFVLIFTSDIDDVGLIILGVLMGIFGVFSTIWHGAMGRHYPNYYWKLKYRVHHPIFKFKNKHYAQLFHSFNPSLWVEGINYGKKFKIIDAPQQNPSQQTQVQEQRTSPESNTPPPQQSVSTNETKLEHHHFCPQCGATLPAHTEICEKCGFNLKEDK